MNVLGRICLGCSLCVFGELSLNLHHRDVGFGIGKYSNHKCHRTDGQGVIMRKFRILHSISVVKRAGIRVQIGQAQLVIAKPDFAMSLGYCGNRNTNVATGFTSDDRP